MIHSKEEVEELQELLCERYESIRKFAAYCGVPAVVRDDIVQEIFVLAYTHLHQLKKKESFDYWLCTIAKRHIQKYFREKKKKNVEEVHYEACEDELECIYYNRRLVADSMDQYLSDSELCDLINKLKPPAPYILYLRYARELPMTKIAELLDLNYNTVKTIEHRARKKLEKMILERSEVRKHG